MPIPNEYKNRSVYHFTHLENLSEILKHGLLSINEKSRFGIEHTSIAFSDIQQRRSCMEIPCGNKGVVHDYVPLYFCKRSSMLLSLLMNKVADQQLIIYFVFPIGILDQYPYVFSDASANTIAPPNFYAVPEDLDKLNWEAIDCLEWKMPDDKLKQARMAELLIHNKISATSIIQIIVWNKAIKNLVQEVYDSASLKAPPIDFNPIHYYIKFYEKGKKHSIITGPYLINEEYQKTVQYVLDNIGKASSPKFLHLVELWSALNKDMACIPETKELIGLETDNKIHTETVDKHIRKVVVELRKLTDYKRMSRTDKLLVEIAAYLHDIGKGPKSRWISNGGRQKVDSDHPIKALPMVQRILTEDVGKMKESSARIICKLVCYHDLIGDIVAKGRRIEELEEVIENQTELEMIIALGKADMMAINPSWSLVYANAIDILHKAMMAKLNATD